MKTRIVILFGLLCVSVVAAAQSSNEKSESSSQGASNGQPFQALYELIDQNRALIEANQTDIVNLQQQNLEINQEIQLLRATLFELAASLIEQEDARLELAARIAELEGGQAQFSLALQTFSSDVLELASQLEQMKLDDEASKEVLLVALAEIENQIFYLETDLQSLVTILNAQINSILADMDENSLAVDSLILEITATTATAVSAIIEINGLASMVEELERRSQQHALALSDLSVQLVSLGGDPLPGVGDGSDPVIDVSHIATLGLEIIETDEQDIPSNLFILDFLNSFSELSEETYLSIRGVNTGTGNTVQHCVANAQRIAQWLNNGELFSGKSIEPLDSYTRINGSNWLPMTALSHWNQNHFWFRSTTSEGNHHLGVYVLAQDPEKEFYVDGNALGSTITFRIGNHIKAACGI